MMDSFKEVNVIHSGFSTAEHNRFTSTDDSSVNKPARDFLKSFEGWYLREVMKHKENEAVMFSLKYLAICTSHFSPGSFSMGRQRLITTKSQIIVNIFVQAGIANSLDQASNELKI